MHESRVLIPVWHQVTFQDLVARSALLADRRALKTADGLPAVARQVAALIQQETKSYRPGRALWAEPPTKKVLRDLPLGARVR